MWFLAVFSPLCTVVSFPPFNLWWVVFIAPIGWIALATTPSLSRGAWIATSLCAWVMWMWFELWMMDVTALGYPVACCYLALFAPVVVWIMRRAMSGPIGRWMPLATLAPIAFGTTEWLKDSVVFNGYPWYGIGQPLVQSRLLSQMADLGGAITASLMVACVAGALVDIAQLSKVGSDRSTRARATVGGGLALCVIAFSLAYGEMRLRETPGMLDPGPRIVAVQTNLTTDNKLGWPRERQEIDVLAFGQLTLDLVDAEKSKGNQVDLVVWPETMLPGFGLEAQSIKTLVDGGWWPGDRFATLAASIADRVNAPLLVGSPAFVGLRPQDGRWEWDHQYNSAYLVDGVGPYQRYDKVFLTPFGETMPYISNWNWLEEQLLALGARGMTFDLDASSEYRRISFAFLDAENLKRTIQCATPICFEDTVPEIVRQLVYGSGGPKQAQLIVNLSNDGWFGFSDWARAQHALIARWRCIENRTPMIRVANTGISQAFTSEGATMEGCTTKPRTFGGFACTPQLDRRETLFGRWGDVLSPSMALCAFILIFRIPRRRLGSLSGSTSALLLLLLSVVGSILPGCGGSTSQRSSPAAPWSSRTAPPDLDVVSPDESASNNETHLRPIELAVNESQGQSQGESQGVVIEVIPAVQASPEPPPIRLSAMPSVALDASASPETRAIHILVEASQSREPIYRAHALEGLQARVGVLQPIACRLLADGNPGVRFAAAVTVGKKRLTECAHIVEPLVLDPSPSVRAAALYALVRLDRVVDLTPLTEMAISSNPEIRANAFFVLGELRNPSAIPLVESAVGRKLVGADQIRTRIVDLQAAESMAKMGDYRQFDPIRAALFAPSEQSEFIALACQMVGETNDRGARGHLIGLWNGKGPLERPVEIRLIAGVALIRIGEPNRDPIFQLCQVAVKDVAPTIRAQAAATLGWVGGKRSLDALAPLLQDPVAMVRLSAANAYLRASPESDSQALSSREFNDDR